MATYRPSFVDVSGLSSGITKGLMVAAEMKKKQDALAEAKSDDFLKTYQPGKLRQMDIPDFTNAYTNYKQSALLYSRLNRGGAKPEELAAAKAAMDKSLGSLNDVYSRSTSAAEKQAEYVGYLKTAREKGYAIPNEVSAFTNALSTTPISKLDVATIPSAYTFELVPKDIEWGKLKDNLEAMGARITELGKVREEYAYATGLDGKPMKAQRVITYKGRNPNAVVDLLSRFSMSDARLSNAAKLDYELLSQGMKNGSDESIQRFREIQQYFPQVQTLEDVKPMMVFGLNLYRRERGDEKIDYEPAKATYRTQLDTRNLTLRGRAVAAQERSAAKRGEDDEDVQIGHPYDVISSIVSSAQGAPIAQDATRELQRYSIPGLFGKEVIDRATYNPDDTFTIETTSRKGPTALRLSPEALEAQIVESSGEFKARKRKVSSGKSSTGGAGKGLKFLGVDANLNPIYKK